MTKTIILRIQLIYYRFLTWWNENDWAAVFRRRVYEGTLFVLERIEYGPRLGVAVIAKLLHDWLEDHPPD